MPVDGAGRLGDAVVGVVGIAGRLIHVAAGDIAPAVGGAAGGPAVGRGIGRRAGEVAGGIVAAGDGQVQPLRIGRRIIRVNDGFQQAHEIVIGVGGAVPGGVGGGLQPAQGIVLRGAGQIEAARVQTRRINDHLVLHAIGVVAIGRVVPVGVLGDGHLSGGVVAELGNIIEGIGKREHVTRVAGEAGGW